MKNKNKKEYSRFRLRDRMVNNILTWVRSFHSTRGYITAYALIVASLSIVLLTGMVIFSTRNQRLSLNESARQQALHAAETGIYYYSWYLAHSLNGKNAQQIKAFWEGEDPLGVDQPFEQVVEDFQGQEFATYSITVTPPEAGSTIVTVESEGSTFRHPEIKRYVKVRFRRPSWSEYTVLANDVMRFGEGTSVYGAIHSNNGIRFDGVAHNLISSAVATYYDPDINQTKPGVWTSRSNPEEVFLAGKKFPVPAIDFNGVTADFAYMKEEAQDEGIYLGEQYYTKEVCTWYYSTPHCPYYTYCQDCEDQQYLVRGYHLTLRTDDKVEIRRVFDYDGDNYTENGYYNIIDQTGAEIQNFPTNGIIFVENNVWVDGSIDTASLSIASAKLASSTDTDIYINNDILYTNKDGRDTLGLVAENNISVGYYSEDELEIDAALLAQKGRVGRDHYSRGSYRYRDTITLWGAMATNQRYGFAWTDGTGYDIRNLYFDNNLLYTPPPFFPTGTEYDLDLWEEQ